MMDKNNRTNLIGIICPLCKRLVGHLNIKSGVCDGCER